MEITEDQFSRSPILFRFLADPTFNDDEDREQQLQQQQQQIQAQ